MTDADKFDAKSYVEKATQIQLNFHHQNFFHQLTIKPFLGRHLGFHIFFIMAFLGATYFFYSWAVYPYHAFPFGMIP